MKRLIIIILIAFGATTSYSQIFPPTGSHNYHPELDKFVGTWKWSSGNNEIVVKIKKIMYHFKMNGGFDEETLAGCHRYVKNGVIIEDFLPQFETSTQSSQWSLLFSTSLYFSPDQKKIWSSIKDNIFNRKDELRLTFSDSSSIPTLIWELSIIGTAYRPGIDPTPIDDMTMPENLILTKQP